MTYRITVDPEGPNERKIDAYHYELKGNALEVYLVRSPLDAEGRDIEIANPAIGHFARVAISKTDSVLITYTDDGPSSTTKITTGTL